MSCDVFVNNCLLEKKVTEEVKSIMGPSNSSLYCAATNSMRKIHRKPKRKAIVESVSSKKKKK